jgi:hypothetical protein
LGQASDVQIIAPGRSLGSDCEPDFKITFGQTEVYFLAAKEENFSLRELELVGEKGFVYYSKSGEEIEYKELSANLLFPDYTVLNSRGEQIVTEFQRYQWHVVDALSKRLNENKELNSTIDSALESLMICEEVSKIRLKKGND